MLPLVPYLRERKLKRAIRNEELSIKLTRNLILHTAHTKSVLKSLISHQGGIISMENKISHKINSTY